MNGTHVIKDLEAIKSRLSEFEVDESSEIFKPAQNLGNAAISLDSSWSQGWLGYHSRVYYRDFVPIPAGARFSVEWGFYDMPYGGTLGEWCEYDFDTVVRHIEEKAGNPDLEEFTALSENARITFQEAKSEAISVIEVASTTQKDTHLEKLLEELHNLNILSANSYAHARRPSNFVTRDPEVNHTVSTPPHIAVAGKVIGIKSSIDACKKLSSLIGRLVSHVNRLSQLQRRSERIGTSVFIGHGRSVVWKDLKDFVKDRLRLPYDEFNRVPVAGITNISRLNEMLDSAAVAFIIMTAEDEQLNGSLHARMNVIHEVGLFQGRLGFTKAIVLLEDGCEEFSNIEGLGQIRFPAGNIKAVFEDIRAVLEREEVIQEEIITS